jgi:hypothetical protein
MRSVMVDMVSCFMQFLSERREGLSFMCLFFFRVTDSHSPHCHSDLNHSLVEIRFVVREVLTSCGCRLQPWNRVTIIILLSSTCLGQAPAFSSNEGLHSHHNHSRCRRHGCFIIFLQQ